MRTHGQMIERLRKNNKQAGIFNNIFRSFFKLFLKKYY